MTTQQLKKIEAQLKERGYRKYTRCLTSSEAWAWFKTFDKVVDKDGETAGGYQVAFRVWDCTKYGYTGIDSYGLDFWTSPIHTDCPMVFTANWEPSEDFDRFEAMAKDFYEMTKKYINQ